MKNSKKVLACTLGLMLGVGILAGCGAKPEYTVTFKEVTETLHKEVVKEGDVCPEYVPEAREGYSFMGWYTSRTTKDETTKFDFTTPITSDLTLYAWYKQDWKPSTLVFYAVGSFEGGEWDGAAGSPVPEARTFTHTVDEANQLNKYELTINKISFGEKFRVIKSTDGLVSDDWTNAYGWDMLNKIIDAEGNELVKADYFVEEDDNNIGAKFSGKINVSFVLESDYDQYGEMTIQILEEYKIEYPDSVGLMGTINGWADPDIDLTTADEGATWTITYDFNVGDDWKVRANDAWDVSWGYAAVASAPEGAFGEATNVNAETGEETPNGNIRCLIAGSYVVTLDYLAGTITIVNA